MTLKYKTIGILFVIFLFNSLNVFVQENKKFNGPKILFNPKEITVYDDKGKVIKKKLVNNYSYEELAIRREVKERVCEKMGLKSSMEACKKKLDGKFNMEVNKLMKVVRLKKDDKIKFINGNGDLVKEIDLKTEEKLKEKTFNKQKKIIKIATDKSVAFSKNNRFIGINIRESNLGEIDKKGNEKSYMGEGGGRGKFQLLNEEGNIVWEKEFPEGVITYLSPEPLISDNGNMVVIQTEDINRRGGYSNKVYVFDKNGSEILVVPDEKNNKEDIRLSRVGEISPNGKYLGIRVKDRKTGRNRYYARFINLTTKAYWDSKENLFILNISDEGIA
ncbi:MAG: hypothetical protein L6420_09145, partial [Elusimicrobia bacterium]|nr:hypothetical protein [Elusimicrobiota bacterium]